ncbi:MAG: hypothetical protein ACRD8Z_08635, partial [Nitrososphaeraceae archaeon]
SSTLQIRQPFVSRDLQLMRNEAVTKNRKELGKRLFFEQLNILDGVGELMKNLWKTIDDPRVQVKERTKAMKLMLECYNARFQIIDSQTATKEFMEYAEKVKADEQINAKVDQELGRREKILHEYLEKNNIDFDKIDPISQRKF